MPVAASRSLDRVPRALLWALVGLLGYAAFADGATDLPKETSVQTALLALAAVAAAWTLFGPGGRPSAPRLAWAGIALLAAFAAWTGASITWSVAPDRSWAELNRGVAVVVTALLGVAIGSALPAAPRRLLNGLTLLVTAVALYAIGGKVLPGLRIPGLLDLDHAGGVSRLRAPLDYWNALALMCAFGVPLLLARAADRGRATADRDAGLAGVLLLLVVLGMTYSRGGLLALAAGLAVLFALFPHRWRALALLAVAAAGAALVLAVAFSRPDLTTNALPLERRSDDGLVVLAILGIVLAMVLIGGRVVRAAEDRIGWTRRRAVRARRVGLVAGAATAVLLAAGVAGSGAPASFTEVSKDATTDPARLLSTNSGNRWTWWQEAAGAWSDKPVRGWGAGSFPVTHRLYRRDELAVLQPHSVPLQFLAETGLVGLVLGLGGLLALTAAALSRARRSAEPACAAGLAAIPVAWLVHCWLDWDWDIPAVTLPMVLVAGVLAARPERAAPVERMPGDGRAVAFAAVVVVLVCAALSAAVPAVAQRLTERVYAGLPARPSAAELRERAARAELAARLDPTALEPLFAAASLAERAGSLETARRHLLRAIDRQPYAASTWFRLARVEFARDDRAALRRAALRALELDPRNGAALGLAARAAAGLAPPSGSATATGTPLLPAPAPVTQPVAP